VRVARWIAIEGLEPRLPRQSARSRDRRGCGASHRDRDRTEHRPLGRLLAHIEKRTIAQVPHREWLHVGRGDIQCRTPMINDALRTSRRRFLTQVGAAGLGIAVPVSTMMAQETQRSSVGDGKEVSLGEKLARYATSLRYEDLPEEVIRIAKRTILDTLGCAFGGYSAGPSKIAMKLASDVNSKQPGTILLSGIKTSPELAV